MLTLRPITPEDTSFLARVYASSRAEELAITDWSDDEATAVSDVVFLLKADNGWAIQVVGRYHDTLHRDGATWRFHRRTAEFVPD